MKKMNENANEINHIMGDRHAQIKTKDLIR